ncbi:MAG: ribonuclease P protein component [bacterium]|nr:ribonuclease P protein component [bacterium]
MKIFSFSRDEKLKKYNQIKLVFTNGKRHRGAFANLYVRTNDASRTRLGIVVRVPKAFKGRAVQRNRIKRLVREFYRLNKHTIVKGIDLVFEVFLSSAACRHDDIKTNAFNLCKKAGILQA